MTFVINNSEVEISCWFDNLIDNHVSHMYGRAMDGARGLIDLVAFQMGMGVSVILDRVQHIDGKTEVLSIGNPNLPPLCTALNASNYNEVHRLIMRDPGLFLAVNDLIAAVSSVHLAAINCARAVEGIRHLISNPGMEAEKQWPIMREKLNLTRIFINGVMAPSKNHRHGYRSPITGEEMEKITEKAWIIMDRYLHYLLRGGGKLPLDDFPHL